MNDGVVFIGETQTDKQKCNNSGVPHGGLSSVVAPQCIPKSDPQASNSDYFYDLINDSSAFSFGGCYIARVYIYIYTQYRHFCYQGFNLVD